MKATETGQKKKRKKSKKRKRKSIDEENVTEAEKIRRSVQRAAQSYTLKLLENKKLDKKERKKRRERKKNGGGGCGLRNLYLQILSNIKNSQFMSH